MASRLAARLLTGPLAFFVAGLLDILSYLLPALGRRLRREAVALVARAGARGQGLLVARASARARRVARRSPRRFP